MRWGEDRRDKGHPRSAWPPHSYDNISFLQERYESGVLSRHIVAQIRAIPTLIPKVYFAYQSPEPAHADGSAGHEIKKESQRI